MKKLASPLIFVLALSFMLFSCKKDEPETYWYSYGTYVETEASSYGFVIDLDNGYRLIPEGVGNIESDVKDSSRIVVVYAIVSETDSTVNARTSDIYSILTKGIVQLTEENKDSMGTDGIIVNSSNIWFSKNHLNVEFGYYGYTKTHFINLVKPIGAQEDTEGNQILEFKHNANNDLLYNWYTGMVSFDMWSLYEEGMDSLPFVFKSVAYDSSEFSWKGTYYFNSERPLTKNAIIGTPQHHEILK